MDELNDNFKKSAEDFSMKPSSGVWKNVEADIRRRERKRRFIIFFLMGVALLSGGVIYLVNPPAHTTSHIPMPEEKLIPKTAISSNKKSEKSTATLSNRQNEQKQEVLKRENPVISSNQPSGNSVQKPIEAQQKSHFIKEEKQRSTIVATAIIKEEFNTHLNSSDDGNSSETINVSSNTTVQPDSVVDVKEVTTSSEMKADTTLTASVDSIKNDSLTAKKDTVKSEGMKGRWSISLGAAIAKSFSKHEERGDYQFVSNYRDSSDKNLMTWDYHFSVNYHVIRQLEIYTGFGISNFEQEVKNQQAIIRADTNLVITLPNPVIYYHRGYFNINGDSTGTNRNKVTFLEIPFGLKYSLLESAKFDISFQPEITFGKVVRSSGYFYNSRDTTYHEMKNSDFRNLQITYGAGISFGYLLSNHFSFEAAPFYRKYYNSIFNSDHSVKQNLRQFEIRLSLVYGF